MTDYYLDSSMVDDSGNGLSPATAWKYLTHLYNIGGSNRYFLKCGSVFYQTSDSCYIYISSNGSEANPLTFDYYGSGNKPIVHVGNSAPIDSGSWSGPVDGVYSITTTQPKFLFEDEYNLGRQDPAGATIPTAGYYWYYSGGILYYRPTSGVASDHVVRPSTWGIGVALASRQWVNFQNIKFIGLAFSMSFTSNLVYDGCDFVEQFNPDANGLLYCNNDFSADQFSNITVKNCTAQYVGGPSLYFEGTCSNNGGVPNIVGMTIQNNAFINMGKTRWGQPLVQPQNGLADDDILYLQNIKNLVVQDNELSGFTRCQAAVNHWISVNDCNGIIRRNFIHDVPGYGIIIMNNWSNSHDIYQNIVTNFGTQDNLSLGNGGAIHVTGPQPSGNHGLIVNNTIYNGGTGWTGIKLSSGQDYYEVKNNIIHTVPTLMAVGGAIGNSVINYNDYYPTTGTPFSDVNGARSWAQWQGDGFDANGVSGDPLFINAGGSYALDTDFKLQSGSKTCINAGVDVGLTTDYGGESIVGVPDIGAWEFGGGFRKIYVGGLQCNLTVI